MTKSATVRSAKIRKSAENQPCTVRSPWCNGRTDTTVWAHSPFQVHGHGTSIKSGDIFGCYACSACHDALDGRTHAKEITREEKQAMYLRGNAESWQVLIELGIIKVA
jgi:hypothetical protein